MSTQPVSLTYQIGTYLAFQRKKDKLSLHAYAKKLSVDTSYLYRLEKGYYASISLETVSKIASALEMTLEEFLRCCSIITSPSTLPSLTHLCQQHYHLPSSAIADVKLFVAFLQHKHAHEISDVESKSTS